MSILISGSIAFDTIIQTVGNFRAQDMQKDDNIHLSLFSPMVRKENGGTAANIAYSLALLGKPSHLIASIGEDGKDTLNRLQKMGINTELVQVAPGSYCPQAYILRDQDNGQINTFHAGAMSLSGEITHGTIPFEFAIAAPDSKEGIMRRIQECSASGIFTIFDPGQAMGLFSGDELRSMVVQANITIMNEPERKQFKEIAGEDYVSLALAFGHTAIETLSEKGACIYIGTEIFPVAGIYVEHIVDATGCGDSFRSGLLYGLSEGWDLIKSCQLGNIIGGIKIQFTGPQNHTLDKEAINIIGEKQFGVKFFD